MLSARNKLFLHKVRIIGFEKLSSYFDMLLYYLFWPTNISNHVNVLLFTGEHLPPRIGRMAKWIKRSSDYTIVLLCYKNGFSKSFVEDEFDAIYLFRNEWHLKRMLRKFQHVSIIHGFAPKSRFPYIVKEYLNAPYVQDMQDVYSIYHEDKNVQNWLKKELPFERKCILEADGLVAHSLEMNQLLRKEKPVKYPATLFFPLYCDDDMFQNIKTKVLSKTDVHIVYAGGVSGSHRDPTHYGNTQFHSLIETLTQQKLHFHIYPSPTNVRSDWEEYVSIAQTNDYFHFHPAVSQSKLASELCKYDFGILPFFKSLSELSELKLKYATSLKLFNYLEAGLPVIVSEDIGYQHWIAHRYNCGISINDKNIHQLGELLKEESYEELTKSVEVARQILSLKGNTQRLLTFYNSL